MTLIRGLPGSATPRKRPPLKAAGDRNQGSPAGRDSLRAANVLDSARLIAGTSHDAVRELAMRENRKWSLLFVDGDHEGEAPLRDVIECEQHAEPDAAILLHDLTSPDVAAGIRYLRDRGWKTRLYHTMQIVGIAWRGNVTPVEHVPDPNVKWAVPEHLRDFNFSMR